MPSVLCQVKGQQLAFLQENDKTKFKEEIKMGRFSHQPVLAGATVNFCVCLFYGGRKMGRIDSGKEMMDLRDWRFRCHFLAPVSHWMRVSSFHQEIPSSQAFSAPTVVLSKAVWETSRSNCNLQGHKKCKQKEEGIHVHACFSSKINKSTFLMTVQMAFTEGWCILMWLAQKGFQWWLWKQGTKNPCKLLSAYGITYH